MSLPTPDNYPNRDKYIANLILWRIKCHRQRDFADIVGGWKELTHQSDAEIAEHLRVDPGTIYRWRHGRTQPYGKALDQVCDWIKVNTEEYLRFTNQDKSDSEDGE